MDQHRVICSPYWDHLSCEREHVFFVWECEIEVFVNWSLLFFSLLIFCLLAYSTPQPPTNFCILSSLWHAVSYISIHGEPRQAIQAIIRCHWCLQTQHHMSNKCWGLSGGNTTTTLNGGLLLHQYYWCLKKKEKCNQPTLKNLKVFDLNDFFPWFDRGKLISAIALAYDLGWVLPMMFMRVQYCVKINLQVIYLYCNQVFVLCYGCHL